MLRSFIAAFASLALVCPAPAYAGAVHDALEAYALYQNDVSTLLDADINAGTVDAALARVQRHNSDRVARGWIAYGALTASQSPRFADAIHDRIRQGRAPVLRALRADVAYARQQQGGPAVQLILSAASADNARLETAGARYDRYARTSASTRRGAVADVELGGETQLSADMLSACAAPAGHERRPSPTAQQITGMIFPAAKAARRATGADESRAHTPPSPITC